MHMLALETTLTNINNTLLSNRWPKYTLSPSVQFAHDNVLSLH